MTCASCGRVNRAESRFCVGCGRALAPRCPACGVESEPDAQFCGACGAALVAPAARAVEKVEARKVVTIVFADLIGSTALHERLDPESVRRVMEDYHGAVRVPVEAHGGTVVQLLGDGVMCAFGVPHVGEDDAIRAVRAAVGIQQAFRDFARDHAEVVGNIGLRVAVNTGEVVVSDDYAAGIGDPLNVAARLQQEARDGDVLVGESTERLVRDRVTLEPLGVFQLKGRTERVAAYRVVSLDRPAGVAATPFVGREDELGRIAAVYDAAVAAPAARLVVILGSPGLGKSRLLDEIGRGLDGATVLRAQCEAAGGNTFAPLARAVRNLLHVDDSGASEDLRAAIAAAVPGDDSDRARISEGIAALLAATPASPEETFFVIRRFLAALAATPPASPAASQGMRPVVLAIDDLQWAEPLLLDLIEHLVQWGSGVPLLVLAAARPDLRDRRSSLAIPGGVVSDVVTLAGLDAGAATRLAADVVGAAALPAAVAGRVLATSEGNPLFVTELVRMLINDGALERAGDRWVATVDLATLQMPPTIHALLAARIERLRAEDRLVLERAAVVGRQFSRAAVAHLLPGEVTDLDARLEALRRSELIEPDAGWFLGEPALRFHHGLTRDAAYRRVLKGTRAELHGRCAQWIEGRVGETVEHDEMIGWHLEQAHQHLRELGPIDERGRALGERAARYLAAAGRRALARDDVSVAARLLGRAIDRLEAADPARADLALDWCEALLAAGEVGPAAKAIDELARIIGLESTGPICPISPMGPMGQMGPIPPTTARLRAWHTCFAGQLAVLTDPQALHGTAAAVAAAAEKLTEAGDAAGEAKAHLVHALALSRLGRIGACEAELDKALAAARRANDRRRSNTVLANAPLAALWGPSPVTRASGRCLDVVRVLRITQEAPAVEAVALRCQAVLEALRGRAEAARRMIASSRRMVEELGNTQGLLENEFFAGLIELFEGDTAAAERSLRAAYEGLRSHGLGIDAARAAALLGRTLLAQGRAAEAEALSHESEALAGDDLQAAITWRRVRAEALARRGEHAAAVDLARAAVDIAAATDALLHHADARLALAVALRAAGRQGEAAAEEARAIELWEAKGATVLAERTRRDVGRGEPVERTPDDRARPARPVRGRVRANAATANAARFDAAFAARDADALPGMIADGSQTLDHMTGTTWDRGALLRSFRYLMRAEEPTYRNEPLGTLGDSLVLCRWSTSANRFTGATFDVGAYQRKGFALLEFDALGRHVRGELFAADRLGDAVARLYERYAELLPEGPARTRAAATARVVAALLLGRRDSTFWATVLAPSVEFVDHGMLGFGSVRGAEAFVHGHRALLEIAHDLAMRVDDVLALRTDALLVSLTVSGTLRAGGGAFERPRCHLWVFGDEGFATRIEWFDVDRDADALARFDELAVERPHSVRRRVPANAATAHAARLSAAIAARDTAALPTLIADEAEVVHHPTHSVYGRGEQLRVWRTAIEARDGAIAFEPLATLGDSLALCRQSVSASAAAGENFDIGPYEVELIALFEVDEQGRRRRSEFFASDHLSDAVARLYARYAELLPDGTERARAVATARSLAALDGPLDLDRWAAAIAPDIVHADHRTLGLGPSRGAAAFLRGLGSLLEVADHVANRIDDVLAVRSDAILLSQTNFGTERAGGGAYERPFLMVRVFGADGLLARLELFDLGHEAEALARFDELVPSPDQPRRTEGPTTPSLAPRIENAAARTFERAFEALSSRDWKRFAALFALGFRGIDRRKMLRNELDRDAWLVSYRPIVEMTSSRSTKEVLATRGDRLVLARYGWEGTDDVVGPSEIEYLLLIEVDDRGDHVAVVMFDPGDVDAAYAELDERYAAGEAAAHELEAEQPAPRSVRRRVRPNAATANAARSDAAIAAGDADALPLLTEDYQCIHHPTGTTYGRAEQLHLYRRHLRTPDLAWSTEPLATLGDSLALCRLSVSGSGTASGTFDVGAFEVDRFTLIEVDAQGRRRRTEVFAAEHLGDAVVRLYERYAELLPDGMSAETSAGPVLRSPAEGGGLRSAGGLPKAGPEHTRAGATARAVTAVVGLDLDGYRTALAPELEFVDHRPLGFEPTRGAEAYVRRVGTLLEISDEITLRVDDVLDLRSDALLVCFTNFGTARAGGGSYERSFLVLWVFGADGLALRSEMFEADRADDALARFDELTAEAAPLRLVRPRVRPNAATANAARVDAAIDAQDVDAFPTLWADESETVGHGTRTTWGRQGSLAAWRSMLRVRDAKSRHEPVATLGDSLALCRWSTSGSGFAGRNFDVGAYEREEITLVEVDAQGRRRRTEAFPVDRLGDAVVRLYERYAELLPEGPERTRLAATARSVAAQVGPLDLDRMTSAVSLDCEWLDRRIVGFGAAHGAQEFRDAVRTLFEAADNVANRAHDVLALRADALLIHFVNSGTQRVGGGAYERAFLMLWILGPDGLVTRMEQFDVGHEAEALTRFDELTEPTTKSARTGETQEGSASDPLTALGKPNAATAARDRAEAAFEARDWALLRALCAVNAKFEERRRHVLVSVDLEGWIAERQRWARAGAHQERRLHGTAGDRVALERVLVTSGPAGGRGELEYLSLTEVDDGGRIVAGVVFDLDDWRAAYREAWTRWFAADAVAAAVMAPIFESAEGWNDHDPDRVRNIFADSAVVDDRRRAGMGLLEGADAYVDALAPLWKLAPDVQIEPRFLLALEDHGMVSAGRIFGTFPEGGPFEGQLVWLFLFAGGRINRLEIFEIEDVDAALARFEELRAEPAP